MKNKNFILKCVFLWQKQISTINISMEGCPRDEQLKRKVIWNLKSEDIRDRMFSGQLLILGSQSRELEIFVEDEVLDESDNHLLFGEIPKTHADHTKWERLDTSSSPLCSIQMESSFPLLFHHCMSSCQQACPLVGSSTSEAISWRRAQSRQSLQTPSNPWLRPSSCRRISQVIAGSSWIK